MIYVWVCSVCHEPRDWGSETFMMSVADDQRIWLLCKRCKVCTMHDQIDEQGNTVKQYPAWSALTGSDKP
jgi:hypothetical protein